MTRTEAARRNSLRARARRRQAVKEYARAVCDLFRPETAGTAWIEADTAGRAARSRLVSLYGYPRAVRLMMVVTRRVRAANV